MVRCLLDWLVDLLIDWLIAWLSGFWLIIWFVYLLNGWLLDCRLIDCWLSDWLINLLVACLIDWLIDWLFDVFMYWMVDWLNYWFIEWLINLLIDWFTYLLMYLFIVDWVVDLFIYWKVDWLIYLFINPIYPKTLRIPKSRNTFRCTTPLTLIPTTLVHNPICRHMSLFKWINLSNCFFCFVFSKCINAILFHGCFYLKWENRDGIASSLILASSRSESSFAQRWKRIISFHNVLHLWNSCMHSKRNIRKCKNNINALNNASVININKF